MSPRGGLVLHLTWKGGGSLPLFPPVSYATEYEDPKSHTKNQPETLSLTDAHLTKMQSLAGNSLPTPKERMS